MRILYVSGRLPFPPNRGDRISTFNHIRYLSRRHTVTVASLFQSDSEAANIVKLADWAESMHVELQTRIRQWAGMLIAFVSGKPLSMGNFYNPELMIRIREIVRQERIEAVVVHSSSMGQYVEDLPDLVRVMYFADMDSQKWADMAVKETGLRRWIYERESRLILEHERAISAKFSASAVVTESEARLFKELIPDGDVHVIANGVDFDMFGQTVRKPESCELIYLGMMDYEPNVEAVCYFVRNVWPLVRAARPDARFNIVGGRPTREVKALADVAGVRVTGFVDDVRDYLATATLMVVPLDIARGLQNKLLEAMAAGVPVLTTPASAKGLGDEAAGTIYVETREPRAFSKAILDMVKDEAGLRKTADAARAFVRAKYSWESKVDYLEKVLIGLQSAVPAPGTAAAPAPAGPTEPLTAAETFAAVEAMAVVEAIAAEEALAAEDALAAEGALAAEEAVAEEEAQRAPAPNQGAQAAMPESPA